MGFLEAAEQILRQEGKPLPYNAIKDIRYAISSGGLNGCFPTVQLGRCREPAYCLRSYAMEPNLRPWEHIGSIRREKFKLTPEGILSEPNPLAGDLQNSIRQLSEELYREDTHFILELIQNAEDNFYPTDTVPELSFTLLESDPTDTPDVGTKGAINAHVSDTRQKGEVSRTND